MKLVLPLLMSAAVAAPDKAVIWMHGLGDTHRGWISEVESWKLGPTVKLVLPDAPVQRVTCNGGMGSTSWFDIEEIPVKASSPSATAEDLDKTLNLIETEIKKLNDEGIPSKNIVVGGFSQGGSMAMYTVYSRLKDEDKLAGCVCLSGWYQTAMATSLGQAPQSVKDTKMFWGHGDADGVVWGHRDDDGVVVAGVGHLKNLGITDVQTHVVKGMGHGCDPEESKAVKQFIIERLGLQA